MRQLSDQAKAYTSTDTSNFKYAGNPHSTPVAEIQETPETITLRMELFEVEPQKLYIKISSEAVSIHGERKLQTKQNTRSADCINLCHDSFQHVIPLPARIQNHQAYAEFKDGVLYLSLPKIRKGKTRLLG